MTVHDDALKTLLNLKDFVYETAFLNLYHIVDINLTHRLSFKHRSSSFKVDLSTTHFLNS